MLKSGDILSGTISQTTAGLKSGMTLGTASGSTSKLTAQNISKLTVKNSPNPIVSSLKNTTTPKLYTIPTIDDISNKLERSANKLGTSETQKQINQVTKDLELSKQYTAKVFSEAEAEKNDSKLTLVNTQGMIVPQMKVTTGNVSNETKAKLEKARKLETSLAKELESLKGGSILEKIGYTAADLGTNIGEGFLRGVEGATDFTRYSVANVAALFGNDEYAKKVRENAKEDTTSTLTNSANNVYNEKSLLKEGGVIEFLASGGGYLVSMMGLGTLMGGFDTIKIGNKLVKTKALSKLPSIIKKVISGANISMPSLISAAGSATSQAYNAGATDSEATLYGLGSGLVEGLVEGFGGQTALKGTVYGKGITDVIKDSLVKKVTGRVKKTLVILGFEASTEGMEDVIGNFIDPYLQRATYNKNAENTTVMELAETFMMSATLATIVSAPGSITAAKEMATKEMEDKIQKLEQDKTINTIENKTNEATEGINTINTTKATEAKIDKNIVSDTTTLGSETTTKELLKSLESSKLEYNKVKNTKDYESIAYYESKIDSIKSKIKEADKVTAKVAKVKTKIDNYKSTKDFKLMTELADKVGYKLDLVDGKTTENGSVNLNNKTISVNLNNIDSNTKTGLNIVSHEVLHTITKNSNYKKLETYVMDTFTKSNQLDDITTQIKNNYKSLTDAQIKEEIVAHFIEQNAFQTQSSVNELFKNHRNIFDVIYKNIKQLVSKVKGTSLESTMTQAEKLYKKALETEVKKIQKKLPIKETVVKKVEVKKVEPKKEIPTKKEVVKTEVKKVEVKKELPIKKNEDEIEYPEYIKTEEDKRLFRSTLRYHNMTQEFKDLSKKQKETPTKQEPKKELPITKSTLNNDTRSEFKKKLMEKIDEASKTQQSLILTDKELKSINVKDRVKLSLIGINAKLNEYQTDMKKLAIKLNNENVSADKIWVATGWEFNEADKDWRYEIHDGKLTQQMKSNKTYNLGDVYNAPELYEAYPEMKNLKINTSAKDTGYLGAYDVKSDSIDLNSGILTNPTRIKLTLLHEIQHAIQEREGFASGGSPILVKNAFKQYNVDISSPDVDIQMRKLYRKIAGEVEAVNVSKRNALPTYTKQIIRPGKTQDTTYEKQLVRQKDTDQVQYKAGDVSNVKFSQSGIDATLDSKGNKLSKEQQEFFKDSKVRDEKGRLLEVYHGTKEQFYNFGNARKDMYAEGTFFTDYKEGAAQYAKSRVDIGESGVIIKAYLNMTNPWIIDAEGRAYNEILENYIDKKTGKKYTQFSINDAQNIALRDGYNGLIVRDVFDFEDNSADDYIVFNANQVKSVDNTTPTKNEDIRFSKADIDARVRSRREVNTFIKNKLRLDTIDFSNAKNKKQFRTSFMHPLRVAPHFLGNEMGAKINAKVLQPAIANEANKYRFQNKERSYIKSLNIKSHTKESAAVQKYGEGMYLDGKKKVNYTLKDLQTEFPTSWQKIKTASEKIKSKYSEYLGVVNNKLAEYGFEPVAERKDYFMHFKELGGMLESFGISDALTTNVEDMYGTVMPDKRFFSSQLRRKGYETEYDAIKGIDKYIQQIGEVIYHTEDIQNIRYLENHIATLNVLKNQTTANNDHLGAYRQWLNSYANKLAGKQESVDKALTEYTGKTVQKGLQIFKRGIANSLIGLNPASALTNFIAPTMSLAKTNKIAFVKGLYDIAANTIHSDGLLEKSDFFTNRLGSDSLSKTKRDKVIDFGFIMMKATDHITAQMVLRGKYNEYIMKGYSEDNALRKADAYSTKLMAGRTAPELPVVFTSKTLGLITQFQLEAVNNMDVVFTDTFGEDYSSEKEGIKNTKSYNIMRALSVFAQLLAYSYIFNNVYEEIVGRRPALDPLGVFENAMKHFQNKNLTKSEAVIKVIDEITDQIPFAQILTGGGKIPVVDILPDIDKIKSGSTTAKKEILTLAAYTLIPTGAGQIKKTYEGSQLYKHDIPGKYTTTSSGEEKLKYEVGTDPLSVMQSVLFGQYSSKNAQAYFDNNYSALGTKQTELYRASTLPIEDFREYAGTINKFKADKDEDGDSISGSAKDKKIEYIQDLDITKKNKDLLYEYIGYDY